VNLQANLVGQQIGVRRACAPTLYWLENAPRGEQRKLPRAALLGRNVLVMALPADEFLDVHDRCSSGALSLHGH
jgi:hypothetical protein